MFICQSRRIGDARMNFKSINPATEESIATYPEHSPEKVERRLRRAESAFGGWKRSSFSERTALTKSVAMLLRSRRSDLAGLMTAEMGKPIVSAEQEIDKCADACDYFADHADAMLKDEPIESDAAVSYIRWEPLGAVLAIMPWNFPFWQ